VSPLHYNAMILKKENILPYRPQFFNLNIPEDFTQFEKISSGAHVQIFDTILDQIRELIKLRNPSKKLSNEEYDNHTKTILNGIHTNNYGIWIYYPWSHSLVHTLAKDEFIEVRTSRNQYKITVAEREQLAKQKIGVVGLSVGQSIALTMAIERICGEIRLADFDTLELSNLNRLRSGIQNLGIPKVIIAAREIAEIDPFIDVTIFSDGLTDENMDAFFGEGDSKLNLLVEVCDGLDMKIKSRYHAKKLFIPVVMDTNDRGMLDIERFDLEPDRPILHGLAGDLNPQNIKNLTNEEKIPHILKMVGADTISARLKASMMEVEQTLNTWPQLASSVQLGGAITTDVCRRILLDQLHLSGRFYIDMDELISDTCKETNPQQSQLINPFEPLDRDAIKQLGKTYFKQYPLTHTPQKLSEVELSQLMDIAIKAPSAGNNQPWKWFQHDGRLLLLHDRYRSWSWGDYAEMGALMGLGAAIESVALYATKLGYTASINLNSDPKYGSIIAELSFELLEPNSMTDHQNLLANSLDKRHTNRAAGTGEIIDASVLKSIAAEIEPFQFNCITDKDQLRQMGQIIASCDRLRLLHPQGHEEFFHEVRWNHEEAQKMRDGIDIASIDLSESDKAGFLVAKDYNAIKYLYEWDLGNGFTKASQKSMSTASAFGIVSIPIFNREELLKVGGNILRAWTMINLQGVSFYPMLSPAFFLNRLTHGEGIDLPIHYKKELQRLQIEFKNLCPSDGYPIFMFRLALSKNKPLKTFRMEKQDIYIS
jgi:hypothetical protein